jgi:cellulose synthase/poly-beta-1,6-N-acetylglucosamine synthase-like glycosyltransferase
MDIFETVLSLVLYTGGAIYFSACLLALLGLFRHSNSIPKQNPFVSVIIAARNESENIGSLLDDLLNQDYPPDRFEIIAVDDNSNDTTGAVIKEYSIREKKIHHAETNFSLSPYRHKKKAIHEGIIKSKGEIIMTVDADCRVPNGWIRGMVSRFDSEIELAAGEVMIEGKGILAWLETLEFTGIQAMAAGCMNMGFPLTCNGANMAYRRSAFDRVKGFEGIAGLVSGDDDLLMQKIARGGTQRVAFVTGKNTAVRVGAVKNTNEFISKRIRWASKIRAYPSGEAIFFLSAVFIFFAAALMGIISFPFGLIRFDSIAAGLGMKITGDLLLAGTGAIKAGKPGLLFIFPFAEILHIPYILFVTVRGYFGVFEWRGRKTGAFATRQERSIDGRQLD